MDNSEKLTIGSLMNGFWAWRWLIVALSVAVVGGAVAYAFLATPVYRAESVLAPNRDADSQFGTESMLGSLGSMASFAGLLGSGESLTDEAIATLRSRAFLQKFIESENLLPHLYAKDWDAANRDWKPGLKRRPTATRAWEMFRDKVLRIEEMRGSGLYEISVEWPDPKMPSAWLAKLIGKLNEEMRARQLKESNAVLEFLKKQVERTDTVEVRAALFRLAETQLRRAAVANVRQDYAFRIIDPPFPSEKDQFVRPRRVIIIALSIVLAGALAVLVAAFAPRRSRSA